MATRASKCEVETLIGANGGDVPDNVMPFLNTANLLVTRCYGASTKVDAATAKELELYLAAHLATMNSERLKRQKLGTAEDEYVTPTGDGLSFTTFGQTVLLLDPCGCLKNFGKKAAQFVSVGGC